MWTNCQLKALLMSKLSSISRVVMQMGQESCPTWRLSSVILFPLANRITRDANGFVAISSDSARAKTDAFRYFTSSSRYSSTFANSIA